MTQAKQGDSVKVHYTGKLNDGTVFYSTTGKDPLKFTIGRNEVLPGFEQAVVGMTIGESKSAKVIAGKGYGPHREEMVVEMDRERFPNHIDPQVGQQYQIPQADGQSSIVTIIDVSEELVTLDGNHPLAGKDLVFDIQLVEIA
jgi:FKBP-type peptidyl-prolyl cis-trans isomerase 2